MALISGFGGLIFRMRWISVYSSSINHVHKDDKPMYTLRKDFLDK